MILLFIYYYYFIYPRFTKNVDNLVSQNTGEMNVVELLTMFNNITNTSVMESIYIYIYIYMKIIK